MGTIVIPQNRRIARAATLAGNFIGSERNVNVCVCVWEAGGSSWMINYAGGLKVFENGDMNG